MYDLCDVIWGERRGSGLSDLEGAFAFVYFSVAWMCWLEADASVVLDERIGLLLERGDLFRGGG